MQRRKGSASSAKAMGSGTMPEEEKLTRSNWLAWSPLMHAILVEKGLQQHVSNMQSPPAEAAARAAWQQGDERAKAMILRSVTATFRNLVHEAASASAAWTALEAQHTQGGAAREILLRQELHSTRQGRDEGVQDYFARLEKLWRELVSVGSTLTERDVVVTGLASAG